MSIHEGNWHAAWSEARERAEKAEARVAEAVRVLEDGRKTQQSCAPDGSEAFTASRYAYGLNAMRTSVTKALAVLRIADSVSPGQDPKTFVVQTPEQQLDDVQAGGLGLTFEQAVAEFGARPSDAQCGALNPGAGPPRCERDLNHEGDHGFAAGPGMVVWPNASRSNEASAEPIPMLSGLALHEAKCPDCIHSWCHVAQGIIAERMKGAPRVDNPNVVDDYKAALEEIYKNTSCSETKRRARRALHGAPPGPPPLPWVPGVTGKPAVAEADSDYPNATLTVGQRVRTRSGRDGVVSRICALVVHPDGAESEVTQWMPIGPERNPVEAGPNGPWRCWQCLVTLPSTDDIGAWCSRCRTADGIHRWQRIAACVDAAAIFTEEVEKRGPKVVTKGEFIVSSAEDVTLRGWGFDCKKKYADAAFGLGPEGWAGQSVNATLRRLAMLVELRSAEHEAFRWLAEDESGSRIERAWRTFMRNDKMTLLDAIGHEGGPCSANPKAEVKP